MATVECRPGKKSTTLSDMPENKEDTTKGSSTVVGMAWTRVHIDHAGPIQGKMILVIVDAHSKWIDAHVVASTSTSATLEKLRTVFATHGLPEVLVSDNGPAFSSTEFREFTQRNGIKHLTSAPYHPASNGLAERAVQTVKEGMKKMSGPLEVRLSRFLFKYRVTPQATTGIAPAELLMGRRLRTHLDLLYPTLQETVRNQQRKQQEHVNAHARHVVLDHSNLVTELWVEILQLERTGCLVLCWSVKARQWSRSN
jgi:transposase InsO family protein